MTAFHEAGGDLDDVGVAGFFVGDGAGFTDAAAGFGGDGAGTTDAGFGGDGAGITDAGFGGVATGLCSTAGLRSVIETIPVGREVGFIATAMAATAATSREAAGAAKVESDGAAPFAIVPGGPIRGGPCTPPMPPRAWPGIPGRGGCPPIPMPGGWPGIPGRGPGAPAWAGWPQAEVGGALLFVCLRAKGFMLANGLD